MMEDDMTWRQDETRGRSCVRACVRSLVDVLWFQCFFAVPLAQEDFRASCQPRPNRIVIREDVQYDDMVVNTRILDILCTQ